MYIPLEEIRIKLLCLNCISDPSTCRITAGIVDYYTVSAAVRVVWEGDWLCLEPQRESEKHGVE